MAQSNFKYAVQVLCRTSLLASIAVVCCSGLVSIRRFNVGTILNNEVGPRFELTSDSIDLGEIQQDEIKYANFSVHNRGSQRLVINEKSCGCGQTLIPTLIIGPGKTESIAVPIDTECQIGPFKKTVELSTNDQLCPSVTLTVTAQIITG